MSICSIVLRVQKLQLGVTGCRGYALCCKPRPPPPGTRCGCPPIIPGGQRIQPPPTCRPEKLALNPCMPHYHETNPKYYKYLSFFVMFPLIIIQALNTFIGHEHHHKGPCRDYEYMRVRTKRFPWGDGKDSLFHDPAINHSPGECENAPLDCD